MRRLTTMKKALCLALAVLTVLGSFAGCGKQDSANAGVEDLRDTPETEKTIEDYRTSRVGAATGTYPATILPGVLPDAQIVEYNTIPDMVLALNLGKIDTCAADASYYTCMLWEGMALDRLKEPLVTSDYGMVFQKGKNAELRRQFNAFIAEMMENGAYEQLQEKWFGDTEPTEFLDPGSLTGTNGTIKVITTVEAKPFAYLKDQQIVGYDIDVLTLFAEKHGYQLEITDVSFPAVLLGISQGKYDIAACGFTITPERAESVDFSYPYHQEDVIFMIQKGSGEQDSPSAFFDSLRESFEKTFLRENRWKLILEGIFTTLIISFFAVLGGTALGFLLYMAVRSQYSLVSGITKAIAGVYAKLIAGTPTLVVLMLLCYVVFGKVNIDGIVVAIIGFILTFGSFVYGQLALTVEGVDKGQTEAAYALGYSRNRAFFRIVLPQAMKMFVPVYSAEIVGLIKATSVVGYIAVNDLTKMGDIIRSNTYEAFFPLIAVAVIYFMITWGASALLDILRKKTEPKRRKDRDILKGVVR